MLFKIEKAENCESNSTEKKVAFGLSRFSFQIIIIIIIVIIIILLNRFQPKTTKSRLPLLLEMKYMKFIWLSRSSFA